MASGFATSRSAYELPVIMRSGLGRLCSCPPLLEDTLVVADIRKCIFLNRLKRHVPIIVKSRSGIELQATEDIEVFRSAKVSVSSVISTKEHGGDASQTGFPNPRLSHQLKAVIQ